MSARTYLDTDGREMFVHDGISGGRSWGTFRRKPSGSLQRVCSPALPMQPTQGKAQMDLDDRAKFKGWKAVGEPEKGVTDMPAPRTVGTEDALITDIEVDQNIREATTVKPEFVASIKDHGVIEPLIVTLTGPAAEKPLYLVAGHRRLLGAQEAGLERVPCQVRDLTPRQIAEFRFVENIHREDLSPLEEARAMKDLAETHGLKQSEIARIRGKSQEWVSNRGRLLTLPDPIQDLIRCGILSASAALETHRLIRYPDLAARVARELEPQPGSAPAEEPVSVSVAIVRDRVQTVLWANGRVLDGVETFPECRKCDQKERVYERNLCMDRPCWLAKKEAGGKAAAERPKRTAPAQPDPKAAEPSPVADAPPAVGYLPRPLRTCPAACPDIKDGLCGKPKSDCRKTQVRETQAAAVRELAESEERSRVEEAMRAEIRARHLGRVESYLRHRIASNQKGFSHPEMRLVSLALLEGESGLDYVAAVLGGVFLECQHHASTAENYSEALLGLSTRTLTTLAVGYLLLGADGYLSDPGCVLANTIAINIGLAPEPEDGVTLDASRLVNPAGEEETDPQTDPESPADPNHDPDADAADQEGASLTPGPSEDGGCDERNCADCKLVPCLRAHQRQPHDLDCDCDACKLDRAPTEAIDETPESLDTGAEPLTGTLLAAFEAEAIDLRANPSQAAESKSSKAARNCKGDRKRCDQKHCDIHPSHAVRSHPEFEEGGPTVADQPELAPLSVEKASYGPNPAVTKCPLRSKGETLTTPEQCLACCRGNRVAKGRRAACCYRVTSDTAPFHCPGGLDICPTAVGGESDAEPAPITVCPASKDATTEAECKTCCTGNRPESGCCVRVLAGHGPYRCPGPAACPEATVPAPKEEAVPFVTEVGATCGPCPARDGKPVTEAECRTCNEERQTSGQECCPHVISGQAPFRCPVCDKKTGCQTAAQKGVE